MNFAVRYYQLNWNIDKPIHPAFSMKKRDCFNTTNRGEKKNPQNVGTKIFNLVILT